MSEKCMTDDSRKYLIIVETNSRCGNIVNILLLMDDSLKLCSYNCNDKVINSNGRQLVQLCEDSISSSNRVRRDQQMII